MNNNLHIALPTQFSIEHERLILKYLTSGRRSLILSEWRHVLNGFDLLHQARVVTDNSTQTFKQVYAIHVEQPFADSFINELLLLDDVGREQQVLRARFARSIVNRLNQAKLRQSGIMAVQSFVGLLLILLGIICDGLCI